MNAASRENIKVVCRLRPLNSKEQSLNCGTCLVNSDNSIKLQIVDRVDSEDNSEFTFDRVFNVDSTQAEVFDYVAKPIVESALEGWNGTLFCYGQTASGKTHTMEGVHDHPELKGVIPRMMAYVFELIREASTDCEFTVKCSFLEIYNEKIQDLLDPRKNNLLVKEEKVKGIWVEDATEVYVLSKEEMHDVFKVGSENRKVGGTNMNAKSSRSHSLFIVTIFQKNTNTLSSKTGKVYFVDLAGSEKMSKTGIEGGVMLEEAKNINKSLLNLGMVINALTEGRGHVPYRDSKLTRVLQESLGGNSHTTLIVNCSVSRYNDKESLSTLRFGQRAKAIKNRVVLNTERSPKDLLITIKEQEEKIKYYQSLLLDRDKEQERSITLSNTHINTTLSHGNCADCSNAMRKLLNQHIEMVTLQDELEMVRKDKLELEEEIQSRGVELLEVNERVLISELRTKLFIEEELTTFQELQFRLEHVFLLNQNKLLETNKIRNTLEKMRYEMLMLMKSNKLKFEKSQMEEFLKYNSSLEESLKVLNKIEEYIISDNKSFNDIVDFIAGKNSSNANANAHANEHANEYVNECNDTDVINSSLKYPTSTVNNIHLNINKNISINVYKNEEENTSNERNERSGQLIEDQDSENHHKKHNSLTEELVHCKNYSQIVQNQRKTITDLALQFKSVKDTLSDVEKANLEKEHTTSENLFKTENKIKVYEEIINELNEKIMNKQEEFDLYKTKSMLDFQYKEKKQLELINRVGDLEDENHKLMHYSKDKDKKKFFIMERQIKDFTNEMSEVIADIGKLRSQNDRKEEEIKHLHLKVIELENRLVQTVRSKMNEVSFAGNGTDLNSSICTPMNSYLNAKGFQCSTLGDILTAKLRTLKSISPKSDNSYVSKGRNSGSSCNTNTKDFNLFGNRNSIGSVYIGSANTGNNIAKEEQTASPEFVKVIRGGGGGCRETPNNVFFSNAAVSDRTDRKNPVIKGGKINLDKLRKDKHEEQMKFFEEDLNHSRESEIEGDRIQNSERIRNTDDRTENRSKTPIKDKGGFFNFFSKIIK